MCLHQIGEKLEKTTGIGWKVFTCTDGKIMGEIFSIQETRPVGKWLNEKNFRESKGHNIVGTFPNYTTGWHIFVKRKDAILWRDSGDVVRKVKYRKAHTRGTQDIDGNEHAPVMVAKEMLILPKSRKPKKAAIT